MPPDPAIDSRNITHGREIPSEGYSDQPYVVINDDGSWLCVMTTGQGHEGAPGQHVVTTRSTDQGKTWSDPVDVEPAGGPEASYAVLLKVPGGRIYCFYNHNTDNLREVIADDPPYKGGKCRRVDSQGYFVFKFSDDGGRTWSDQRTVVPIREMDIDRKNAYEGKVRFFWNVGRPFIHDGAAFVSVHKVGGFGEGFFTRSEGVLLKSENILTESDPEKITWQTLPDGDAGLRAPSGGGPIAEEQMSDGSFYCVYRTIDGHPACAYSRDGGHTWTEPQYKRYADGRVMRHPRAANFAWRCQNGKFLYWFHNHGGNWYEDRNPVWLCGGVEADTPDGKVIEWSQPEIVLYDDDPFVRMSYPDLIEDAGRYFLTETQKDIARVHEIDPVLLEGLWNQFDNKAVASDGLVLDLAPVPEDAPMPKLPDFVTRDAKRMDYGTKDLRPGFALDLWIRFDSLDPNQIILDSRSENGQGICLQTATRGTVEIILNDGRTANRWDCDPGMLNAGTLHHIAVIIDGGPKIILFLIDGKLCDGGEHRQFGWGRYSPNLRHAKGADTLRVGANLEGEVKRLRIYDRAIRTSEAVGNYQAGV
ncbi:MAG: hypothetical protein GXP25_09450 [Planctomycetes bacterium]|nr:hypothetical protein [Planctomycetota bacterium]